MGAGGVSGVWNGVDPLLHVVLHEPEIPNNTGNIGRTCVALGSALHLIEPLGFDVSEKACRRAGLDYWPRLDVRMHDSWAAYEALGGRRWILTTRATRPAFEADFRPGDHLVFGRESRGLPGEILERHPGSLLTLPMVEGERSLNVASAVCSVMYLALGRFLDRSWVGVDVRGKLGPANGVRGGGE